MHIEFRHLRTIRAIHDAGGVARAADLLNITQSALSHQIKGLEEQTGVELFIRKSKPIRLSVAGQRLLKLANKILPEIDALQSEFDDLRAGKSGRLHIAIECHACFEWLFPVLEKFRQKWPDVDIDIKPGLAFEALPALQKENVDLVISSDPEKLSGITFTHLFDYESVFVASARHPFSKKKWIEASDFATETLITYPVDRTRLDVFSQLLIPNKIEPAQIRQADLTSIILLLVASDRGVTVLPDWVVSEIKNNSDYTVKPLKKTGVQRGLFAATRTECLDKPFMRNLIDLAGQEASRLQKD
ncbi:MAG: LysR family transcriptional regulator [Rhodobacteraceae bacterium TMED111]|nr:MAG: LysR family transcriptional regulator [Rhodobacteraceae bacterium TMED111]